jgi:hypothetical protein
LFILLGIGGDLQFLLSESYWEKQAVPIYNRALSPQEIQQLNAAVR